VFIYIGYYTSFCTFRQMVQSDGIILAYLGQNAYASE